MAPAMSSCDALLMSACPGEAQRVSGELRRVRRRPPATGWRGPAAERDGDRRETAAVRSHKCKNSALVDRRPPRGSQIALVSSELQAQAPLMTTPNSCPATAAAAPSAGDPPVCLAGVAGVSQEMVRPRMVLFGDSITEQSFRPGGWGAALADTYSRKADVVVRGYGGYNTRWALFLIHHIFPLDDLARPLATTIFFGANDAALLGRTSERQHVPVSEYKENLKKIVNHLKDCSKSMVIVLITPPPVDEDGRERFARSLYGETARKLPERANEMAGVYAGQCIELAREMHIPCINIWSKMQETEGWEKLYLSDGLHLTPEGNAVVYKEVVQTLRASGLKAEDMPYDFPHHSKIDGSCPEKAFQ